MPVLKPLSGNPEAPKQYNQPSRKGKKAWRKNVDVTEVEQGLEELNAQIIKGYGPLILSYPANQLVNMNRITVVSLPRKPPKNSSPSTSSPTLKSRRSSPSTSRSP